MQNITASSIKLAFLLWVCLTLQSSFMSKYSWSSGNTTRNKLQMNVQISYFASKQISGVIFAERAEQNRRGPSPTPIRNRGSDLQVRRVFCLLSRGTATESWQRSHGCVRLPVTDLKCAPFFSMRGIDRRWVLPHWRENALSCCWFTMGDNKALKISGIVASSFFILFYHTLRKGKVPVIRYSCTTTHCIVFWSRRQILASARGLHIIGFLRGLVQKQHLCFIQRLCFLLNCGIITSDIQAQLGAGRLRQRPCY